MEPAQAVRPGRTLQCDLNGPINAISQSPDGSRLVAAGRDVLSVLQVKEDSLYATQNLRVGRINLTFSSIDVVWHPLETYKNWIATAATNGAVVLWDLGKGDVQKQARVMTEHSRTVNRVTFHPSENFLLLSGSQDGTMKMWDLRSKESTVTFEGRAESVRDVQFNPHVPTSFGAAFENGTIQVWDLRNPNMCEEKITSHQGPAFCIDWHPEDKNVFATAGRDKIIKMWKLGSGRAEVLQYIHTIASVGRVAWRPQHRYQVASCSLVTDNSAHIWDMQRPYIPLASFTDHKDLVTDLEWHMGDPDTPITVSKDKTIIIHKYQDATFPEDYISPAAVAWSVHGDLVVASSTDAVKARRNKPAQNQTSVPSYFGRTKGIRPPLPPPVPLPVKSEVRVFDLNEKPPAGNEAARGRLSLQGLTGKSAIFGYLARHYVALTTGTISETCKKNAKVAETCGAKAAAQSWHILALLCRDLEVRATALEALPSASLVPGTAATAVSRHPSTTQPESVWPSITPSTSPMAPGVTLGAKVRLDDSPSDFQFPARSSPFGYEPLTGMGARLQRTSTRGSTLDGEGDGPNEDQDDGDSYNEDPFDLANEITDLTSPLLSPTEGSSPVPSIEELRATPPLIGPVATPTPQIPVVNAPHNAPHRQSSVVPTNTTPPWKTFALVADLLRFYAEEGDVQMCVSVLGVLGSHWKALGIDMATREQWTYSYIDLLHRMKLFSVATELIKSSAFAGVKEMNQDTTQVHATCGRCNKHLMRHGWACENCRHTNICSLCHQTVKGPYTWCQGCSHGGHLEHMLEWFRTHDKCPTGCGHRCQFS